MKPVKFKNKVNGEQFICNNVREVQYIDGVDYLVVHKIGNSRTFLMRREILEKISDKKEKIS